jgi:hypothetical protein
MNRLAPARKRSNPLTLLRWELKRGRERLICQVEREPGSSVFSVIVVPLRSLQRASVERFDEAVAAIRRHAALAAALRADGWSVAAYTR